MGILGRKKTKMKIKPTLRAKKRYLAFEIISKEKIKDFKSVFSEIWAKMSLFAGEKVLADAHAVVLKDCWVEDSQKGIIKINHNHVDSIKASLLLVERIDGTEAIIKTLGVSGILKKAKAKYLAN